MYINEDLIFLSAWLGYIHMKKNPHEKEPSQTQNVVRKPFSISM